MSIVVLAEKPSVARDLAAVLGATQRRPGYLEGNGYKVTWAVGHLVEVAQPHEMNAEWKAWRPERLPILPESWPLVVRDAAADQFSVVAARLTDRGPARIVAAADAGRGGERIVR
jgi:DNA topoisomerase-3